MGAVYIVPELRTTGNAFIINLSLADLFVTSVTQPANILGKFRASNFPSIKLLSPGAAARSCFIFSSRTLPRSISVFRLKLAFFKPLEPFCRFMKFSGTGARLTKTEKKNRRNSNGIFWQLVNFTHTFERNSDQSKFFALSRRTARTGHEPAQCLTARWTFLHALGDF